jgi:hypothetical protein
VPAGVTEQVTFLLPAKNVTACWIWVNPVPGQGGSLFETSDAPVAGEIFILEGGQGLVEPVAGKPGILGEPSGQAAHSPEKPRADRRSSWRRAIQRSSCLLSA